MDETEDMRRMINSEKLVSSMSQKDWQSWGLGYWKVELEI